MPAPTAFLCHSSKDKVLAHRLATELRAAGVEVWYDAWEIRPGDSLRRKIDEGIEEASYFVALITVNSLQSAWVQTELDAAMVRRINEQCRLIPVVYGEVQVPATLAGIRWVRLTDEGFADGVRELVGVCHEVSLKPPLGAPPAWTQQPLRDSGLSVHAQRIAVMLNERSSYGTEDEVWLDVELVRRELGATDDELLMAFDELQERGMVKLLSDANSPIGVHSIGATRILFFELDPHLKGWYPASDARALAAAIVNTGESGLDQLAQALGWELRRINPAAYYLDVYGYAEGLETNDLTHALATIRITPKGRRFAISAGEGSRVLGGESGGAPIQKEKWVDHGYPEAAGIVREEEAKGYRLSWCPDEKLARKVDIEGSEVVKRRDPADGSEVIFRVKDRPSNLTLMRTRVK